MFIFSLPEDREPSFTCDPNSYADVFLDIFLPGPWSFIQYKDDIDAKQLFTVPG